MCIVFFIGLSATHHSKDTVCMLYNILMWWGWIWCRGL